MLKRCRGPFASEHHLPVYRWAGVFYSEEQRGGGAQRDNADLHIGLSLPVNFSLSSSFLWEGEWALASVFSLTSFGLRRRDSVGYLLSRRKFGVA